MNKLLIVFCAMIIAVLIAVGLNVVPYFDFYAPEDITEFTDLFDYSSQPITNWNGNSHEFKFHQKITSVDGQNIENASVDVLFYSHNRQIAVQSSEIDKLENGSFDLDFTIKLDSEPDAFYYNVTDVNWA